METIYSLVNNHLRLINGQKAPRHIKIAEHNKHWMFHLASSHKIDILVA